MRHIAAFHYIASYTRNLLPNCLTGQPVEAWWKANSSFSCGGRWTRTRVINTAPPSLVRSATEAKDIFPSRSLPFFCGWWLDNIIWLALCDSYNILLTLVASNSRWPMVKIYWNTLLSVFFYRLLPPWKFWWTPKISMALPLDQLRTTCCQRSPIIHCGHMSNAVAIDEE